MSTPLTLGTNVYNYPVNNQSAGWGEDASDWAIDVTARLNNLSGINDIPITSAIILNNQTTASDITSLSFNISQVKSMIIDYYVRRTNGTIVKEETGRMNGNYNGTSWTFQIDNIGDGGVVFDITSTGQVQYYSDDISGGTYSGIIKFKATTIDQ